MAHIKSAYQKRSGGDPRAESSSGLLVVGMHRSGTSAVTGLLHNFGYNVGQSLLPGNEFNEKGYFEDTSIVIENENMLVKLSRSWCDERPIHRSAWHSDAVTASIEHLATCIISTFDLSKPWIIKDPRIARLLPAWQRVFQIVGETPAVIICIRHPEEVAASLWKRDGIPPQRAYLLYALHLLEAEGGSRCFRRAVIDYGDLITDWRHSIDNLLRRLGPKHIDQLDVFDNSDLAFITASLRHHLVQHNDVVSSTDFQRQGIHSSEGLHENELNRLSRRPWHFAMNVYNLLRRNDPFENEVLFNDLQQEVYDFADTIQPWLEAAAQAEQRQLFEMNFLRYRLLDENDLYTRSYGIGSESVLYWREGDEDYSEKRRITAPLSFGIFQTIQFKWGERCRSVQAIRWDITDRSALIEVRKCTLVNPRGKVVWSSYAKDELFGHMSNDLFALRLPESATSMRLMSTGKDPYVEIMMQSDVLSKIKENWVINFECRVDIPTKALSILNEANEPIASRVRNST